MRTHLKLPVGCLALLVATLTIAGNDARAQTEEVDDICGKKLVADGNVRSGRQLAELSAVQNWLEAVAADSPERAVWHRAQNQTLQCESVGSQGSVRCTVSARPCAAPPTGGETDNAPE